MTVKTSPPSNTADLQVIKDALAPSARTALLVNLTVAERKQLYKTGESGSRFVQNAKAAAKNNPGCCPAFFDVTQFASDVNLFAVLTELRRVQATVSQTDDTRVALAPSPSRARYRSISMCSGVRRCPNSNRWRTNWQGFQKIQPESTPPPAKQTRNGRSCARTCDS